ncbi:MAG: hypothetical protein DLM58_13090 [Pseudonocardiales bacterium]|nr:MAG: hypothetical protein DLM58_13090 [Pseudonocardiales bacterium]
MMRQLRSRPIAIALVCQGMDAGGGVPAVVRWLQDGLAASGNYTVHVHDLAASRTDQASRRILSPRSWTRASLQNDLASASWMTHWGANAVEIEVMRYRPRTELTRVLSRYDVIQVVAGSSALAAAVVCVPAPVCIQVATTAAWERASQVSAQPRAVRVWRRVMTALTARVERKALRAADFVMVENDTMLAHVLELGQRRVGKAPPGVDTDRFVPNPHGWRRDGYLLSVCRLSDPRKGLDRMIRAYSELTKIKANAPDLMLVGKGDLTTRHWALIDALNLRSRLQVRSDVPAGSLPSLYQGASLFLQTSHEEGLGIAALEAMASGLPVVCTETAGSRETVVDGVTGWLVSQNPERDVVHLMADRISRVTRDDTGAQMGSRGRQRCTDQFSFSSALRAFTDAYDRVLSKSVDQHADGAGHFPR